MRKAFLLFMLMTCLAPRSAFAEIKFKSSASQVRFIELFSSEARKGSPAAEAWVSALKASPDLWKKFVPLVYHVDYGEGREWWHDKFSQKDYTNRLMAYAASWGLNEPYVPTLVVNGTEWSGWAREEELPGDTKKVGVLTAKKFDVDSEEIRVLFEPEDGRYRRWIAHAALLGSGFTSKVERGDNLGKTLVHDFVVLNQSQAPMTLQREGYKATIELSPKTSFDPEKLALAIWVTEGDALFPVQCTGGWLTASSDPQPAISLKSDLV